MLFTILIQSYNIGTALTKNEKSFKLTSVTFLQEFANADVYHNLCITFDNFTSLQTKSPFIYFRIYFMLKL